MRHTLETACPARGAPGRRAGSWGSRRGVRGILTMVILGSLLVAGAAPASAFPAKLSTNGQMDFAYGSAAASAGGAGSAAQPESKLFTTGDGVAEPVRWWAVLGTSGPTPAAGVWVFELVNHTWTARVKLPSADPWAKADTLFEAGTLYVSTRDDKATSGGNVRQSSLYTIPYGGGGTWGSVLGPFAITTGSVETLTLARDSANRVWVTYESGGQIKAGYTAPGGTSFTTATISKTNVNSEDISSVVAFGGDRVGVVWSDQNAKKDLFAWRSDSAAPTAPWTIETAYGGGVGNCAASTPCADDQLNVKVVQDQVYVVVRSNLSRSSDPRNLLLRRSGSGAWSAFPVSTVSQNVTTPVVLLSPQQDRIWVWGTRGSEVDVWESSFATPSFTASAFIPWTKGSGVSLAGPSSTKQPTTAAGGEVVVTSNAGGRQYWHNEFPPASPPANGTPAFDQDLSDRTDPAGDVVSLSAHATDPAGDPLTYAATGLPPGLSIDSTGLISGTIATGAPAGSPYAASITVRDDDGASVDATDTFSWTVTAAGGGGGGSIAFRSASTGANNVGTDVVIQQPPGAQIGDVLVAILDVKAAPTVTPPAGWVLVSSTANGSNFRQLVYSRVVSETEPASHRWTFNESRAASGVILAYAGVDSAHPVETWTAGTGSTASITAPSATSTLAGAMLVGAFGINANATIAPPAGMTERGEIVSATRIRTEMADIVLNASGPTGAKIATAAAAAANVGQLIVLRPAGPPPNTPPVPEDVAASATAGLATTITLAGTDAQTCELTFDRPDVTLTSGATVGGLANDACSGDGPFRDTATVTYVPPANLFGPDSFSYTVSDGSPGSTSATVVITVAPPPNTQPTAASVAATATTGEPEVITLVGADAETCELAFDRPDATLGSGATVDGLTDAPCTGSVPYEDTASVAYTAPAGFTGTESFTYAVHDGTAGSGTATVSVRVVAPPGVITFRSASTGANNVASTLVIPTPSGALPGDVMIAVVDVKATPTVPTPEGWTPVSNTFHGSAFRQLVYWRVATDAEPASYQWEYSQVRAASGVIAAYAGVDTAHPVGSVSAASGSAATATAPSVTTAKEGWMVVGAFGVNADATIEPPAGMTERGEIVSATRIRTELSDVAPSSAGATGAKTATLATPAANIGQLIALRPVVTPMNIPTAQDISLTATAGIAKTITLTGIDADTCELTFDRAAATLLSGATLTAPVDAPCSGSGPFEDTATVTYTAPVGFSGPDSFIYSVDDGANVSDAVAVTISVSPPLVAPPTSSCAGPGRTTVTTPPGTVTTSYEPQPIDDTTFDAAGTTWRPDLTTYPIVINSGAARLCWLGGAVYGSIPPEMTWEEAHDLNQPCIRIIPTEWMVVDGLRCDSTDDGIRPRETSLGNQDVVMTIEDTYLSNIRDDCLENDAIIGGVLRDNLWDGCNTGISERPSASQGSFAQPPGETLVLDHMTMGLQITAHEEGPGENALFKWSSSANELVIKCSVFKVDAVSLNGTGVMDIPGVIDDSACPGQPTTLVWLGGGAYPGDLPGGITVSADVNVWNAAVADWKCRHGIPAPGCE